MTVINQNPGVTVLHPERLLGTIMLPGVPAEEYSHPSPEIQANLHTYCCSYCSSYANKNNHRQQNRMLSASQCVGALNILNVLHIFNCGIISVKQNIPAQRDSYSRCPWHQQTPSCLWRPAPSLPCSRAPRTTGETHHSICQRRRGLCSWLMLVKGVDCS